MYEPTVDSWRRKHDVPSYSTSAASISLSLARAAGLSIVAVNVFGLKSAGDTGLKTLPDSCALPLLGGGTGTKGEAREGKGEDGRHQRTSCIVGNCRRGHRAAQSGAERASTTAAKRLPPLERRERGANAVRRGRD